jgi:hypothetical protein
MLHFKTNGLAPWPVSVPRGMTQIVYAHTRKRESGASQVPRGNLTHESGQAPVSHYARNSKNCNAEKRGVAGWNHGASVTERLDCDMFFRLSLRVGGWGARLLREQFAHHGVRGSILATHRSRPQPPRATS